MSQDILKDFCQFFLIYRYEHAYISIVIKEEQFIESKRSELYGWTNFLSNCGGLLKVSFILKHLTRFSLRISRLANGWIAAIFSGNLLSFGVEKNV